MIGAIARVSTKDQARDGYISALKQQVGRLKAAGAQKIYVDVASRLSDETRRESLRQMIADVESGLLSQVLITRMDRLTASPALLERLIKIFLKHNVALIALDERIDLTSADGEMKAFFDVVVARREVRTTSLRSKKGHEYREKLGIANSQVPWGYKRIEGKYVFDKTPCLCLIEGKREMTWKDLAEDVIATFWEKRSLSGTVRAIHQKYGIQDCPGSRASTKTFSFILDDATDLDDFDLSASSRKGAFRIENSGLKRWLLNAVLAGGRQTHVCVVRDGKRSRLPREEYKIIWSTHDDCYLDPVQQTLIEEIVAFNHRIKGSYGKTPHLFAGMIFCELCGRPYKAAAVKTLVDGSKHPRYQCSNRSKGLCSAKGMIREEVIESALLAEIKKYSAEVAQQIMEEIPVESPELIAKRQELQRVQSWGDYPEIESLKQRLQDEISLLEQQNSTKENINRNLFELFQKECELESFWMSVPKTQRMNKYRQIVDKIIIGQDILTGMWAKKGDWSRPVGVVRIVKLRF